MDIRAVQKPLKDRYRADPESSKLMLVAKGVQAGTPIACSVDLGRTSYEAQAHPGVGGAGTAACSGDLLLGALAACAQLTCQMVAAAMELPVDDVRVTVEGDLDLAGTLGTSRDASVGFDAIRLDIEIDAPELSAEQLESLREKTERYCVVLQTLTSPPHIASRFTLAARADGS